MLFLDSGLDKPSVVVIIVLTPHDKGEWCDEPIMYGNAAGRNKQKHVRAKKQGVTRKRKHSSRQGDRNFYRVGMGRTENLLPHVGLPPSG